MSEVPAPEPDPETTSAEPGETPVPRAGGPQLPRVAIWGGAAAAVVLLVATLLSLSHTEPDLGPAITPVTTAVAETTIPLDESIPTSVPAAPEVPESVDTVGTPRLSALPAKTTRVATVKAAAADGVVSVFPSATSSEVVQEIAATGEYTQAQVFLVLDEQGDRLHVLLPVRPNGAKGWIDADLVDVTSHDYQIQVSLSGFQMVVQRGAEVIVDTAIGVGTEDTPTIGGEFYTWVLIAPTNSGYGSYAYGLSGFSSLETFNGGDGRMGIHGTTEDDSIGREVSHGCVRVPDEVAVRMAEELTLPLGIPVTVS